MGSLGIKLPENVKMVLNTLRDAGFEAYIVGGCVRDALLGYIPKDWDITTSATPFDVKKLFRRCVDTGIEHGTVTVLIKDEGFEVTTYRIDGEYLDGRHPKDVIFTGKLEEDLKRRDFTINAMAYDETDGLMDLFGGIRDLENRVIRCVGSPDERFCEDALRILRALRFSAQLDFEIDENTKTAMKKLCGNLSKISAERIQAELVKLLISDHPEKLREGWETGITRIILPEFDVAMEMPQNNPHHCYCVGDHIIKSLTEVPPDKVLRLAMLFHDISKPECLSTDDNKTDHFHGHSLKSAEASKKILRRLKFDNNTINDVYKLVKYHDRRPDITGKGVRKLLRDTGERLFPMYLQIRKADTLAQSDYKRDEKLKDIEETEMIFNRVMSEKECFSIKDLSVGGRDLMAAGISQGKMVGDVLERMLDKVIEEPSLNKKEILLSMIPDIEKSL